MALRVLLADESSTIKKVMQLALADFAVEVKSVPVGLDVLSVTKSFHPDIIFADVLLTKRSGYDVCSDLKNDPETAHIPVVLMWSGFMEIDEARTQECRADRRLEKPFDADHLRSIVNDLVAKTKNNPISSFLTFPPMPEFTESPSPEESLARNEKTEDDIFAIPDLNEQEDFAAVPLTDPRSPEEHDEGGWAHQDLSKFKLNLPETEAPDFASKFVIPPDDDLAPAHLETSGDFEEISFNRNELVDLKKVEKSVKSQMMETLRPNAQPNAHSNIDINADMVEKVIREEAREIIESVCWKLIPEIAERVVRQEINKILKDTEL